jgi:dihydrofolate reductase
MKTVLHLGLTANGCYNVSDESHSISTLPKEVLNNLAERVGKAGNLIVGRRTYELLRELPISQMAGVVRVVVSHSLPNYNGVSVVASPVEALSLLKQKGFDTAFVGGGAQLASSFLSQGLVDEIYLNIYPLVSKGRTFAISENLETNLELVGVDKLTNDIVQMHYRVRR